jgi:hypothetical protein
MVFIASIWNSPNMPICEDYRLNVTALPNDRFNLNENLSLDRADMVRRLDDKLNYRAEKFVYLHAGPDRFYRDFIRMLDAVYIPNESIALITEPVQRESSDGCLVIPALLRKGVPRTTDPLNPDGLQ